MPEIGQKPIASSELRVFQVIRPKHQRHQPKIEKSRRGSDCQTSLEIPRSDQAAAGSGSEISLAARASSSRTREDSKVAADKLNIAEPNGLPCVHNQQRRGSAWGREYCRSSITCGDKRVMAHCAVRCGRNDPSRPSIASRMAGVVPLKDPHVGRVCFEDVSSVTCHVDVNRAPAPNLHNAFT
jgi:hypothetical protein